MAKGTAERRAIYLPRKTIDVVDRDKIQTTSARMVGIVYAYDQFVIDNLVPSLTAQDYQKLALLWQLTPDKFKESDYFDDMTRSQIFATSEVLISLSSSDDFSIEFITKAIKNINDSKDSKEAMLLTIEINMKCNK